MERSLSGKIAKAIFFQDENELDIYVEDTEIGSEKIYSIIITRLLGSKFKINRVFSLGGRKAVIDTCNAFADKNDRKRLFIIDGDLNLLCGEHLTIKNLYTLNMYCYENLLIDDSALISFMDDEDANTSIDEIQRQLGFDNWINKNEGLLINLFVYYGLCHIFLPSIQTVGIKYSNYISSDSGFVDADIVNTKISELDEMLRHDIDSSLLDNEKKKLEKNISLYCRPIDLVSGKDYLLPLAILRMKKITKFTYKNESLKIRLAKKCNLAPISNLLKFVESLT